MSSEVEPDKHTCWKTACEVKDEQGTYWRAETEQNSKTFWGEVYRAKEEQNDRNCFQDECKGGEEKNGRNSFEDVCEDGEVILIDAGAELRGYAADITRSWPINGKFTEAQKEIYQVVLDSQMAAIDCCRVGQPYTAPHEAARKVLAEGLIKLGIIEQSLEQALDPETGDLRKWYMHNTSHWI